MRYGRNLFLSGLAILLPLMVTVYILLTAFRLVDGLSQSAVRVLLGRPLPGLGLVLFLVLVVMTGIIGTNIIGKRIILFLESLLNKLPLIKSVYGATKQIIDAFSLQNGKAFLQVAFLEYPRKGAYAIGFTTGEGTDEVKAKTARNLIHKFVPTTPNPTSGILVLSPEKEVMPLKMSMEEGLKLVISGGVVTPPSKQALSEEAVSHAL